MKKNIIGINHLFFLILFLSLSYSVFAIPQSSEWSYDQLTIIYPKKDNFKIDNDYILNFNTMDSNGSIINNSNSDCNGNIYYVNGSWVFGQILSKSSNYVDFELNLSGSTINILGEYFYTVYCNSSSESGYISKNFYVTESGNRDLVDPGMKWLAIVISFIGMTSLLIWITNIIRDESLKPIKTLFFILSVINIFMLGIISYLISLNPFDVMSFKNLGFGYATVNIFIILGFLYNYYLSRFGGIFKKNLDNAKFSSKDDYFKRGFK